MNITFNTIEQGDHFDFQSGGVKGDGVVIMKTDTHVIVQHSLTGSPQTWSGMWFDKLVSKGNITWRGSTDEYLNRKTAFEKQQKEKDELTKKEKELKALIDEMIEKEEKAKEEEEVYNKMVKNNPFKMIDVDDH